MKFVTSKVSLVLVLAISFNLVFSNRVARNTRKGKSKSGIASVDINIFADESLKQKIMEFDAVSYNIHKVSNNDIGIFFVLDNPYDKPNAIKFKNYFTSVDATMPNDFSAFILFTNIPSCKIDLIKMPWYKPNRVGVPVLDSKGKKSYIQFIYSVFELREKEEFIKEIKDACVNNIKTIRGKLDDMYNLVQDYWDMKIKLKNLQNKLDKANKENAANNAKNEELNQKKQAYENEVNAILSKQKTLAAKLQTIEKNLADSYKKAADAQTSGAAMAKNLTDLNQQLNDTNNQSSISQEKLNKMKNSSDEMRNNRTNLTGQMQGVNQNLSDIQKNLTAQKDRLDQAVKDSLEFDKKISENQNKISQLNNIISQNKDYLDKLNRTNLPDDIKKLTDEIQQTKKLMNEAYNKSDNITNDIKKNEDEIAELNKNKTAALADNKVVDEVKKEEDLFSQKDIKDATDLLRKDFPQLSEIYVNNMFEFSQLKWPEAFNYIYAIRPSNYSLYSNVYLSQKKSALRILRRALVLRRRLAKRRVRLN